MSIATQALFIPEAGRQVGSGLGCTPRPVGTVPCTGTRKATCAPAAWSLSSYSRPQAVAVEVGDSILRSIMQSAGLWSGLGIGTHGSRRIQKLSHDWPMYRSVESSGRSSSKRQTGHFWMADSSSTASVSSGPGLSCHTATVYTPGLVASDPSLARKENSLAP